MEQVNGRHHWESRPHPRLDMFWAPAIRLRRETREVEVLVQLRYLRGRPRDDLSCQ